MVKRPYHHHRLVVLVAMPNAFYNIVVQQTEEIVISRTRYGDESDIGYRKYSTSWLQPQKRG
ncbi:unnamed protein product [Ceratitis capitata]|uniref:(Mediterranean fruit fly) hypothetical protein n=1 Tax=Ceratitis capitata TaxID=7213 RepID=A0A811V8W5_CERCA|nr:unnamed protein product [Ceratitis capitata]